MNKQKAIILVVALAIIVVALLSLLFFVPGRPVPQIQGPSVSATPESLGGQIYEQANNPLQDALPDANPLQNSNPIQGIYQNPFE